VDYYNTKIAELKRLGRVAQYSALRKLRDAADITAQKIYTPSVADQFEASRAMGLAGSRVAGAIRDFLASKDPVTARANAEYSFWKNVADVVKATEETERVRPVRGTKIAATIVGAEVASRMHLSPEAVAMTAAVMAPAVEAATLSGMTSKITTGRILAKIADALRAQNNMDVIKYVRQLAQQTGQSARLDTFLKNATKSKKVAGGTP
jgi:hypothetical protein